VVIVDGTGLGMLGELELPAMHWAARPAICALTVNAAQKKNVASREICVLTDDSPENETTDFQLEVICTPIERRRRRA